MKDNLIEKKGVPKVAPTLSYVEGEGWQNDHLCFSLPRQPNRDVVESIASNFVQTINTMATGSEYVVVDNTQSLSGAEFVEFQIKKKHPKLRDLDQTCYRVTKPSQGNTVDIYIDGRKGQTDDLANALRAYQAVLETTASKEF